MRHHTDTMLQWLRKLFCKQCINVFSFGLSSWTSYTLSIDLNRFGSSDLFALPLAFTMPPKSRAKPRATPRAKSGCPPLCSRSRSPPRTREPRGSAASRPNLNHPHALHLIREWSWGGKSSIAVQKESKLDYDGQVRLLERIGVMTEFADQDLKAMSLLGNSGQDPGNINNQLKNLLGRPSNPPPKTVQVPMQISKPAKGKPAVQNVAFPYLAPHDTVSHLYERYPQEFNRKFFGGQDRSVLKKCWDETEKRNDPRLANHPLKKRKGWKTRCIPLMLHGDAVPCTAVGKAGSKSFDVSSFQGLLAWGTTLAIKMYICGMFESSKTDDGATINAAWLPIVMSIWFCWLGTKPNEAWEDTGIPLCGDFFFVIWLLKCDIEHISKGFGLRHHASNHPCEMDECTSLEDDFDNNFHNFTNRAKWRKTQHDRASWKARAGRNIHPLMQFEYLSCENIEPDELHVIHMGVEPEFIGSVFWLLVFKVMGGTPTRNMDTIKDMFFERCRELKTESKYSNLTISMFCDADSPSSDYPKLKGRGAEVKGALRPVAWIWDHFKNATDKYHDLITQCLQHLLDLIGILTDHSKEVFLPTPAVKSLQTAVTLFLKKISILRQMADKQKDLLFRVTIKHHWLFHLGQRAAYINPRRACCMLDEDYVGKLKVVVASVVHGTQAHDVPSKVIDKVQWGQQIINEYGL